jgi:hypothetical protein
MNDELTELYASACLYARDKQLDRKSEDKNVQEFVKCMAEKFAELIVHRVISVYNDSETFKTSHYDDNRVLEYFGIKS